MGRPPVVSFPGVNGCRGPRAMADLSTSGRTPCSVGASRLPLLTWWATIGSCIWHRSSKWSNRASTIVCCSAPSERPSPAANSVDWSRRGASTLGGHQALVYVGENHPLLPVALFSAAWAGVPFVPVNYRLETHQLNASSARQAGALVLTDPTTAPRIDGRRDAGGVRRLARRRLPADHAGHRPAVRRR